MVGKIFNFRSSFSVDQVHGAKVHNRSSFANLAPKTIFRSFYQDWQEVVNFEADVPLNGASAAFYTAFPMCEAQFLMCEI